MQLRDVLLAAAILVGGAATPALAGDQDFTLVNKTGYTIDYVYVSPRSAGSWGNDVMGQDSLDDGEKVNIVFNAKNSVCRYDMMVKYDDGDKSNWTDLNLCDISKITLYWDRKNGKTRAVTE